MTTWGWRARMPSNRSRNQDLLHVGPLLAATGSQAGEFGAQSGEAGIQGIGRGKHGVEYRGEGRDVFLAAGEAFEAAGGTQAGARQCPSESGAGLRRRRLSRNRGGLAGAVATWPARPDSVCQAHRFPGQSLSQGFLIGFGLFDDFQSCGHIDLSLSTHVPITGGY